MCVCVFTLLCCVCTRAGQCAVRVYSRGHTAPIATHCIWLCVVVPLFVLWLLGSQVVTMSPLRSTLYVNGQLVVPCMR